MPAVADDDDAALSGEPAPSPTGAPHRSPDTAADRAAPAPEHTRRRGRADLAQLLDGVELTGEQHGRASEVWAELTGPTGYLWPLALLFFASVFGPLMGNSAVGASLTMTTAFLAVVTTLRTSLDHPGRRGRLIAVAAVAWVLGVVALVINEVTHDPPEGLLSIIYLLFLALLLIAFPTVLVRSFSHRRVTVNTLCATMCAYLIIGLAFSSLFHLYGAFEPFFAQTTTPTNGQYTYFSFITLTTVGYGDLSPGTDVARSMVTVEAIVGQVFLVTVVARVVSLLGEERRNERAATAPAPAPAPAPGDDGQSGV